MHSPKPQVILKNPSEHQVPRQARAAFRGHDELKSNFLQLLKLREIGDCSEKENRKSFC